MPGEIEEGGERGGQTTTKKVVRGRSSFSSSPLLRCRAPTHAFSHSSFSLQHPHLSSLSLLSQLLAQAPDIHQTSPAPSIPPSSVITFPAVRWCMWVVALLVVGSRYRKFGRCNAIVTQKMIRHEGDAFN